MEEKLIEAVRGRTILYNTSHEDYVKIKLKSVIWDQVAKEIGMQTGSEAKIMWDKLRHSLRDALRRQKKCMTSGAAATTLKLWKFQTQMGFLQPYMENSKTDTNLNDESDDNVGCQNYEILQCDTQEADSVVEPESEEHEDEGGTHGTATALPGTSGENTPKRQKYLNKKETVTILLKQSIENRKKRATAREADRAMLLERIQPPSDPLYLFFMSMYETTKKMPPSSQHVVRNHVYKAVTDMEATLLNIKSYQHIQHPQHQYSDYQSSPSTPLSSCSEHSSHPRFTTSIQNVSSEVPEENIAKFISGFSEH